MKKTIKLLIASIVVSLFLTSCYSLLPEDETSAGIYGYLEIDKDSKYYGKDLEIVFNRYVEEYDPWGPQTSFTGEVSEDNSFIIYNVIPGEYYISQITYQSFNVINTIVFKKSDSLLIIEAGDLNYWSSVRCFKEGEGYSLEPHFEIGREEVLNLIEEELYENEWGVWLERERQRL